ncbi:manganese-dependent ADP-ribose/CDP-alcohol diphosphatase-like [Patiria miniata]|uniref:Manganese-dependent ADP-ribose/CDP-alcohol diphosphatase n=1 Tax=Patiria miniata TaxID=46514 RepID=A0A914APN0_PATMI|nr:manganese-dependent ADP-ribose/CDP-alcohol diphosphatase-like [Patiria miniata]
MEDRAPACLFAFGVISDTQYADIDNRPNFTKTCTRYYRNALTLLSEAIDHWTSRDPSAVRPDFVMQLGDILDGFNNEGGKEESWRSLETVLGQFDRLPCPVHHLLGNHEFYNFSRVELMTSRLFTGADFESAPRNSKCRCFPDVIPTTGSGAEGLAAYYHFSPAPGFRIVVLDAYDQSIIGHAETCPIGQESLQLVRSINKNKLLNSPDGLSVSQRRFVAFNGGLGEEQLEWLEDLLRRACSAEEKVIVFGHIPIYPINGEHTCLLWDYQEALKILRSFPCVIATFTGHTHSYRYCVDATSGIHFISFPGIVEIGPGSNGFGTVLVYEDRLVLRGVGKVRSFEMVFPKAGSCEPAAAEHL